ncbi:MAG: M42 family metallopeptidase [Metamycoplasmataceae bacterium]
MNNELYKRLKEYLNINGISRHEEAVVDKLKENIDDNLIYKRDGLGSIIFSQKNKKENGLKVAIVAHMDEVGFLVQNILKNGQLILSMVGGIWPNVIIGTKAIVENSKGEKFEGVFGHTSIHILDVEKRNQAPLVKDLYIDLGFDSKEDAEKNGIQIGDKVYLTGEPFLMNNKIVVGKAMDNRAGVVVIDQLLKRLKNKKLNNQVFIVGSVQEEVGTRGAKTASSIINPDVAIAIDTCASHDTFQAKEGIQKLGAGVALRYMDASTMMDPKLTSWILDLAKKKNIPTYKYIAQGGGTDAAALQYASNGVATITLSIPQRYLHSPLGACDINDIENTIKLIEEIVLNLDREEFDKNIAYK